jgi:hypothetical protein
MPRFKKCRDSNELLIFRALQDAHCSPLRGQDVDVYAISRADMRGVMLEIKTKSGTLRPIQKSLQELFGDRYVICRSVEDALRACGVSV